MVGYAILLYMSLGSQNAFHGGSVEVPLLGSEWCEAPGLCTGFWLTEEKGGAVVLELKQIVKQYTVGDTQIPALKGVDLAFRDNEFVSILGPSGCGKTTLLNIIGGLDRYTSGDLVINGRSTKEYRDADWDSYRNHSIGFVFQSYNLIPHQTVLANVELALTLSGVPKAERRRRAAEALEKVGLGDQLDKKPNQMSGGQMQRVAIARAIVNDPDILLADEPTGALDTATSVQIMEILKEIAEDKLIIMVTHNPELAERYSTRIVRLLDGEVVGDTAPYTEEDVAEEMSRERPTSSKGKINMSFGTALSLSFHNLLTKKARTLLTAFAGSIGIIGIALILALSHGVQTYINTVQRDTLSSYPISIQTEQSDMMSTMLSFQESQSEANKDKHDLDAVYSTSILYDLFNAMNGSNDTQNNLKALKAYLDEQMQEGSSSGLHEYVSALQYQYDVPMHLYVTGTDGQYMSADIADAFQEFSQESEDSKDSMMYQMVQTQLSALDLWDEMLPGKDGEVVSDMIREQYDLLYGAWPKQANEVVLILDKNNEISDMAFYALGMIPSDEVKEILDAVAHEKPVEAADRQLDYEEVCDISFKLLLNTDYYQDSDGDGIWSSIADDQTMMDIVLKNAYELNIVGIIRPNEEATATSLSGSFGYTSALTAYILEQTQNSPIVEQQTAAENENYDVFTGLPFEKTDTKELSEAEKAAEMTAYIATLSNKQKTELYTRILSEPSEEALNQAVEANMKLFSSREKIEEQIAVQYDMDLASAKTYLAAYSDEQLQTMIRQQMVTAVRESYAAAAERQIAAIKGDTAGGLNDEAGYAKVAAVFDAQVAAIRDTQTLAAYYDAYMPSGESDSTLTANLEKLGVLSEDTPSSINLYANTFENKDAIADVIAQYNESASEEDEIVYTDYVALLMSGITTIINAISYGLIAFVAISLVVSSIMIGIITYISVLERTKEIGVLRSIGASKKDISRVFNAEALIVGFAAGAIGIGVSLLLCIPINLIIHALTGLTAINAILPAAACIILVLISMGLTFIAGLIPSGVAAKKDPVEALRSE